MVTSLYASFQVHEDRMKAIEVAIEKDELYETPPPVAAPDSTWLETMFLEAHQQEDETYSPLKRELRNQIRDMRREVSYIYSNLFLSFRPRLGRIV